MGEGQSEIDLYVTKMQSQRSSPNTATTSTAIRELEKDFKILFSRHQAIKDFQDWQSELESTKRPIAVLFLDIDNFKTLNTRLTHTKVDKTILPEAQQIIRAFTIVRGGAYRYGGDEFVMILPNHDLPEAQTFAENVRVAFEVHEFKVDGIREPITVSIGIANYPTDGTTYDSVLEASNRAMNEAKKLRNTIKMIADLAQSTADRPKLYNPITKKPLSPLAERLAILLNDRSQNAEDHDPILQANDLLEALSISEEELAEAVDELDQLEWVELNQTMGMGAANFSDIWPTHTFFIQTDPALKGWNAVEDARQIAKVLSESKAEALDMAEIDKHLGIGPRRLNPASVLLENNDIVKGIRVNGTRPYEFQCLYSTPRTRRFAKEAT